MRSWDLTGHRVGNGGTQNLLSHFTGKQKAESSKMGTIFQHMVEHGIVNCWVSESDSQLRREGNQDTTLSTN